MNFYVLCILILMLYLANADDEPDDEENKIGVHDEIAAVHGESCPKQNKVAEANRDKASNIAQKAAMEAKAAEVAQSVAAAQAAKQVKEQLADKAAEAAQAAEAALAGKHVIVEELEQEIRQTEEVAQEEGTSLQQAQATVTSAMTAAKESQQQVKILQQALQLAQANAINAAAAAEGSQQELKEKEQLLEAAKNRVEELLKQLSIAKADLANTKQAAMRAASAAHEAKENASRNRRKTYNKEK